MTEPIVNVLYSVPYVMFLPIIIFLLASNNVSRVVIINLGSAFCRSLSNHHAGVRTSRSDYTRVRRCSARPD